MSLSNLFKINNLSKYKVNDVLKFGSVFNKNELEVKDNSSSLQGKPLIYIGKPVHGNEFYWKTRDAITILKRKVGRCTRYLDLNHDFGRASLVGVPKTSYDPKNNIIFIQMDNEEWAGLGSKMLLNISMHVLFFFHVSFWVYYVYYRCLVNNKFNVFKKWKEQS